MTAEKALEFAREWYDAWNSHDLDSVLDHYADSVSFQSPFVLRIIGVPHGELRGKHEVRHYFARALSAFPNLCFEPVSVFAGINSVVLVYKSVNGLIAAETMDFDSHGKVCRVSCHYTS